MNTPEIAISSRLTLLEPGMWVIRYQSFTGNTATPAVSLNSSFVGNGVIDFFPAEGVKKNTLIKPGDSIIVRVQEAHAGLLISEFHQNGQPTQIQLRIDRIDDRGDVTAQQANPIIQNHGSNAVIPTVSEQFDSSTIQLDLLGHIARRGDVRVRNAWLGDPSGLDRLEGFAVSSDNLPSGLHFGYSCAGPNDAQPQAGMAGSYVGSRQKAKPITRVAFNTGGSASGDYVLSGEVAFAGCQPLAIIPGQELTGPTRNEHLVAIRVQIEQKKAVSASSSPWDDPRITEIFKSS